MSRAPAGVLSALIGVAFLAGACGATHKPDYEGLARYYSDLTGEEKTVEFVRETIEEGDGAACNDISDSHLVAINVDEGTPMNAFAWLYHLCGVDHARAILDGSDHLLSLEERLLIGTRIQEWEAEYP